MGPDDLVQQQVAPLQRRGKEKGDLRLAELQAAGVGGKRPGQNHERQNDQAHEIGRHIAGDGHHLFALRTARVPEEHEPEIGEARDGADQIARVAQPPQPVHEAVARGMKGQRDEGGDHGFGGGSFQQLNA